MMYPVRLSNSTEDIVEKGRLIMLIDVVVVAKKVILIMYKLDDFQQIIRLSVWKIHASNGTSETTEDAIDYENISTLISDLVVKRYIRDSVREIYPLMIVPVVAVFMEYDAVEDRTDLVNVVSSTSVGFPARK